MPDETTQPAVNVIDPKTGEVSNVDADQVEEAHSRGLREATPEEVKTQAFKEAHDAPVTAGALGALRGATFGGSDYALTKSGLATSESLKAYKEQNPLASGGMAVAGSIAPIAALEFLTGGAATPGLALEGAEGLDTAIQAGRGATALAEASAGTETATAATAGAEALTREGISRLAPSAGTLGHLAKDFGIGAGLAAGDQISEKALGDNQALSAEVLVPAMLKGGAMAGVAGLGLRALARPVSAALSAAQDATSGAKNALSDFIAQRAIRNGAEKGLDEEALKLATSDPIAATDPRTLNAEKALQLSRKQDLGRDLTEKTKDLLSTMTESDKDFHATVRREEANNLLANHDTETVRSQAQEMMARNGQLLEQLAADPDVSAKTLDKAQRLFDAASSKVEKGGTAGDIFNDLNDYKRAQAKLAKFNKLAFGTDQESTLNGMRDLTGNVTDHLENSDIYGQAAEKHQVINAAETAYIRAKDQSMSDFGRTEIGAGGRKVRVLNEDRIKTTLNAFEAGRQRTQMAHLGQLYDAADNLNQVYADSLKNVPAGGMTLKPGDVKNVLDAAVQAKQAGIKTAADVAKNTPTGPATAYQAIGGKLGQPAEYDKGVMGIGEAGLLLGGLHALGMPAPLIGAGAVARAALGGELLPAATSVKVLAMIAKAQKTFGAAADTGIAHLLKSGSGKVSGALLPIVSERLSRGPQDFQFGPGSHAGLSDDQSLRRHAQDLTAASQATPDGHNHLLSAAPEIGSQALVAHQRVLQAMSGALPPGTVPSEEAEASPFDPPKVASQVEKQRWVNTATLLHEPLSILPKVAAGMVTKKDVATLAGAYPAIYQEMKTKLVTQLAQMDPKERRRMSPQLVASLSTFLGAPLSKLQQPDSLRLLQQNFLKPGADDKGGQSGPPPGGGPQPARPRSHAQMKLAERSRTPNQAADAILAGS